jgi:hypothetical protein
MDTLKKSERCLRAQQAKEYLISEILEEAERENVALSEVERKMLHFTETHETLPDMDEINEEFERQYDTPTYEKKIAGRLKKAHRRVRKESSEGARRWKQAVADLSKEDHYLNVMLDQSETPSAATGWLVGIGIAVVFFLGLVLWMILQDKGLIRK